MRRGNLLARGDVATLAVSADGDDGDSIGRLP
jgi:hypothetical protein